MTKDDMLLTLLAIIHRDGGHYTSEKGLDKSFTDAVEKLNKYLEHVQVKD